MSRYNGNSNGSTPTDSGRITYAEVRKIADWLEVFTAWDLADTLKVPLGLGDQFVEAMLWHGIIKEVGEADGPEGIETVYEMPKAPPGPKSRPRRMPPEIQAVIEMFGGFLLYDLRGVAVRIRTERAMRGSMSTPGARQHHKNRERAYDRMERAKADRRIREEKKRRAQAEGKTTDDVVVKK